MTDYYSKRKLFFGISIAFVLFCIVMLFVNGLTLDIQFKGGAIVKYNYTGEIDDNAFGDKAKEVLNVNLSVTKTSDTLNNLNQIVLNVSGSSAIEGNIQNELSSQLNQAFPDNKLELAESFSVDPFIGAQFLQKGLLAILLSCVTTIIYVGIRFKAIHGISAGVMAVIALIYNVIMVFLTYILFKIPIDNGFIAAVLTILGNSINNTIVIYDRIRENQKLYGSKLSLEVMLNKSLSQSMARTINTTLTASISLGTIYVVALIYNLDSIVNFALPMLVGIISGFYSSLFIACPLWVVWNERKILRKKKA